MTLYGNLKITDMAHGISIIILQFNCDQQFSFEREDYPIEAAGGQQLYHIKYCSLIKHSRLDFFSYQPNSLPNDLGRIRACYMWTKMSVLNSITYIDG